MVSADLCRGHNLRKILVFRTFARAEIQLFHRSKTTSISFADLNFAIHFPTVRLKWRAHFAVDILLLHHYERSLAHLSDFDSLVIGLSKYER